MDIKSRYESTKKKWDNHYSSYLDNTSLKHSPLDFREAVLYSLNAGGKRVRPVILLEMAELLGVEFSAAMKMATGVECLHTYSLVHDDLPAMDNDDFRRGIPTSHKKFGEDVAILVGDALQSLSFELLAQAKGGDTVCEYFAKVTGPSGLISGQYLDMKSNNQTSAEYIENMHCLKTGKLLSACVVLPYIHRYPDKDYSEIEIWGKELGHLFQIVDDILDVTSTGEQLGKTPGKDASQNKLTYVQFYGLEKSKQLADELVVKLKEDPFFKTSTFFHRLPEFIRSRNS
jgi:geranylgeranyl pyrophosphate synthase